MVSITALLFFIAFSKVLRYFGKGTEIILGVLHYRSTWKVVIFSRLCHVEKPSTKQVWKIRKTWQTISRKEDQNKSKTQRRILSAFLPSSRAIRVAVPRVCLPAPAKMPVESRCLSDLVPEWGRNVDWRGLIETQKLKNCQKTSSNTSHQHIIPLPTRRFASWASALTTAPTGTEEDANGVFLSFGFDAWMGMLWAEQDWLRPQNPQSSQNYQKLPKDFSKYISSTYHISDHPSPHASFCLMSICFDDRANRSGRRCQRSFLFFRTRCLIGDVVDWRGLIEISKPPKQSKIGKGLFQMHLINISYITYIWSSLSPGVALPHAHLLSRPRQHQRKMPMESSCSLVFWIRCLIGDVMLAQRGPQSSPKNPKRLTQNMPTIARVSVCIVCAPFLPAPLSANVLTNCLQPLRRTSLAFLRRSPVKHTKKDQKSSKIFKKSLAGGKMEKYSLHVQSSEPASQSLTVSDRQTECTKPSSGWLSSRAEESCKIQNSRKSGKHINGTL